MPKLASMHMKILEERFDSLEYSEPPSGSLTAKSRRGIFHLSPSGLCWSTTDPMDDILPAIPDVIASPKERVPLKTLASMYYRLGRLGARSIARISTRVESYSYWDDLRESGSCGLAPDEHMVASFLLGTTTGRCKLVTDFLTDESTAKICGGRRYFESKLEPARAVETLGKVGRRAPANSYLPRDGVLELDGIVSPAHGEWAELFETLGEWCCYTPA